MADETTTDDVTTTDETTTEDTTTAPDAGATDDGAAPDAGKTDDAALLTKGADGDDPVAPADWPDDWRKKMSGEDEKAIKALERYQSPADVAKALRDAQNLIRSGKVKDALPENPTDEQIAAWRKDNGIPEAPDGYLEALPDGLVIGDEDKDLVGGFLESAHAKNMNPEQVASAINWYYEEQEKQVTAQIEADRAFRKDAEDALRGEWGGEYRANVNAIANFLSSTPVLSEGEDGEKITLGAALMDARLPDGTKVGDNPHTAKFLLNLANEINPGGTVAPGDGTSRLASVKEEIASIEKVMREDRRAYDKDEKMQARLRQLYAAEEKLASRAA